MMTSYNKQTRLKRATKVVGGKPKKIKACIVFGCTNTSDQGGFDGALCSPCYQALTRPPDYKARRFSSVYRLVMRAFEHRMAELIK